MSMNIIHELDTNNSVIIAARPVSLLSRIWGYPAVRRAVIILLLAAMWEAYAVWLQKPADVSNADGHIGCIHYGNCQR